MKKKIALLILVIALLPERVIGLDLKYSPSDNFQSMKNYNAKKFESLSTKLYNDGNIILIDNLTLYGEDAGSK